MLSGTPALSKPKDLFPLLTILRPNVFNFFYPYAYRYCDPSKSPFTHGMCYDGASCTRELNYILTLNYMIRRLKKDVLTELPSKRRQKI